MQTLHHFQTQFEHHLKDHLFHQPPAELYAPANYILQLGGKRLRPAMLMLGYYLFREDVEKSLPAALAIEVFHNFTLVHDDIMDAAPLRRGHPTVHQKYNTNTGILSGDVMLAQAYNCLLQLEATDALVRSLTTIFTQTAIEVCQGQQLDMNFENRQDVTIEEYLKMIELKTSVLVAAALKMGALLAGATPTDAQHLYEFGRHLGLAFQLQDDLLDTFGDAGKFGKKAGGDICQNKKTYLYLKALEIADPGLKKELENWYISPTHTNAADEKIRRITQIFQKLHIGEITENLKEKYQRQAIVHLDKVSAPTDKKKMLENFATLLMNREL
ncbi:MAG: polyprenyl synthetase family protein [Saprospiraceae bacterium]|nr:MAG: polyprenyl synthetase family protein [Saprospiraceae bacterium]